MSTTTQKGQAAELKQPTHKQAITTTNNPEYPVKFYSFDEAADYLSVSNKTLFNYVKNGIVEGYKLGGQWRFTQEQLLSAFQPGTIKQYSKSEQKRAI